MTGYFSRLAAHTGIGFKPDATAAASSPATMPVSADQRPDDTPAALPQVEEISVTMTPDSRPDRVSVVVGATDGSPKQAEKPKDAELFRSAPAISTPSLDVAGDTSWEESRISLTDREGTGNSQRHSAEQQSPASQPGRTQPDGRANAGRQSVPPETIYIVENQLAAQGPPTQGPRASRRESDGSDERARTRAEEPEDAVHGELVEREVTVDRYLKEVREWVAAPLAPEKRETARRRDAEGHPARYRDVIAVETEVAPTPPSRSDPSKALEVQDVRLSIGAVTVLIEEPTPAAPSASPAQPKADRTPDQPAREPTRLSRYYLTRW